MREVAVGHFAGEPLAERQAHRLRDIGQEHPQVAVLHQQDLALVGRGLGGDDDGVLVALREDAVLAHLLVLVGRDGRDAHVHLEAFGGKADAVGRFHDRLAVGFVRGTHGRRTECSDEERGTHDASPEFPAGDGHDEPCERRKREQWARIRTL
jgi:hypothetical protein